MCYSGMVSAHVLGLPNVVNLTCGKCDEIHFIMSRASTRHLVTEMGCPGKGSMDFVHGRFSHIVKLSYSNIQKCHGDHQATLMRSRCHSIQKG